VILLSTYLVTLIVAQAAAIGIGLAVERMYTPYMGLMVFIPLYFCFFWLAWLFAVRITRPRASTGTLDPA
jgi:hypothetical protein